MRSIRCGVIAISIVAAIWCASSVAWASPFDVYGPGARSTAMGGAQTANPEGPSAVYDNVAGLAGQAPELRAGAFATFLDAPILLKERPDGYDIPDLGTRTPTLPSSETRTHRSDTDSPKPLYGVTVGLITDFGETQTRAGALLMVPTNGLMNLQTHFADERERKFSNQLHHEIIGSRIHRPVIELGLARQLTDRLAVGVGGTYLPGTVATTRAYVRDPADQSDVAINADVNTGNRWGLLAGVTASITDDIDVGIAYRGAVAFDIDGGNEVQVRGINASEEESTQELSWVPISTPSSLRAGVAWAPGTIEWSLDGRYTFWSSHVDSHGDVPGFSNTIEGRAGAEWQSSEETRLRAGLGFIPTPVPSQTGRTNYVDNTRISGSVGGAHKFSVWERNLEASWFLQFQHLLRRETDKAQLDTYPACAPGEQALCDEFPRDTLNPDTGQPYPEAQGLQTGNPGFPGFTSGGWIGAVGFEVRY